MQCRKNSQTGYEAAVFSKVEVKTWGQGALYSPKIDFFFGDENHASGDTKLHILHKRNWTGGDATKEIYTQTVCSDRFRLLGQNQRSADMAKTDAISHHDVLRQALTLKKLDIPFSRQKSMKNELRVATEP